MCVGVIQLTDSPDTIDTKFLFKGNLLHIVEAPEPSSIQYEYLDRGLREHVFEQLISWFVVACFLVLTYFSVVECFNQGEPVLGAVLISFWNGVIPEINRYLVQEFETHHTHEQIEDSFLSNREAPGHELHRPATNWTLHAASRTTSAACMRCCWPTPSRTPSFASWT